MEKCTCDREHQVENGGHVDIIGGLDFYCCNICNLLTIVPNNIKGKFRDSLHNFDKLI